jgi:hypothetical protein
MARFGSFASFLNPYNYVSAAIDRDQDLLPGVDTGGNNREVGGMPSIGSSGSLSVTQQPTQSLTVGDSSGGETLGAGTGTTSTSVGGAGTGTTGTNQAALDAAKAAGLRTDITNLVNSIKNAFNDRYGAVKGAASEQSEALNSRFADESGQLTKQIGGETEAIGAASAAGGTFDSSYRGNNQDTVTQAGAQQIKGLGQDLESDMARVGEYVNKERSAGEAEKAGYESAVTRLAQSTDLNELTTFKNQVEGRIRELQATSPQTKQQAISAIQEIAPSNPRAQKLQTTLSQVVASAADSGTKRTIGERLIMSAGLSPDETKQALEALAAELGGAEDKEQQA